MAADGYVRFIEPGDVTQNLGDSEPDDATRPRALPQMPAYHLVREDKLGVTLVNIGVGPSNAKTMTDHLAVLRPHCWLMVGHCGGLRRSQQLGDYVLAHAYVRDDHVLDHDLPPRVPVPPIAEIQVALQEAVARVTGLSGNEMKTRMRTGTVVATDDRNWELKSKSLYARFNQSRAIAIDMESATVAANGFRLRVPYGTLLCVSDKPLHGELKLRGHGQYVLSATREPAHDDWPRGDPYPAGEWCGRTSLAEVAASTSRPSAEAATPLRSERGVEHQNR